MEQVRGLRAEHDLAGRRDRLGQHACGRIVADDQQLAVYPPDEEEVEGPGVEPAGHPQPNRAGGRRQPPHAGERLLHGERGRRRTDRVVVPTKEEEHCVATELEQVCLVRVRSGDQLRKGRVEDGGDLLGSFAALAR